MTEDGAPFKPLMLTVTYVNGKEEVFKLNDEDDTEVGYDDRYINFNTLEGRTPFLHTIPYANILSVKEEQNELEE